MSGLQPLKSGLLATRVADELRRAIFSGHFAPGSQLLEAHLAKELQVSQTTVREALVQLDHVGLVERFPNKGTYVTKLTDAEVRDRLALRRLLEGFAWSEAAKRMTPEDFKELEEQLNKIEEASRADDFPADADFELEFHKRIWEKSGNPTLCEMLEKLSPPLFAYMTIRRRERGQTLQGARSRHEAVIKALKRGDPDQLAGILDEHLSSYGELAEGLPVGLPLKAGHLAPA